MILPRLKRGLCTETVAGPKYVRDYTFFIIVATMGYFKFLYDTLLLKLLLVTATLTAPLNLVVLDRTINCTHSFL